MGVGCWPEQPTCLDVPIDTPAGQKLKTQLLAGRVGQVMLTLIRSPHSA